MEVSVRAGKILFTSFKIAAVSLVLFSVNTGIATAQPLMQATHLTKSNIQVV